MCTLPWGICGKLGGLLGHSFQRYNSTTCWSDHLILSVQVQPVCLTHSPKDQVQKFLQVCFLQRAGSAVLSAGQIRALLLMSRSVLLFCPCWKVLPPIPGHGNYSSIASLCWSVLHRHVIPPLLSHHREGSVLGSGSAADSQQLPRGWWMHRVQLNSTALWRH